MKKFIIGTVTAALAVALTGCDWGSCKDGDCDTGTCTDGNCGTPAAQNSGK